MKSKLTEARKKLIVIETISFLNDCSENITSISGYEDKDTITLEIVINKDKEKENDRDS